MSKLSSAPPRAVVPRLEDLDLVLVGSRRVIEKLGFRLIGRLEDDVWRDGRWWSVLAYELTQSEWSDVSTTMRVNRPRLP